MKIKNIITAVALSVGLVATANARVSQTDVQTIMKNITAQTGDTNIKIIYDSSTDINAYASCGNTITVTKGAMDELSTDEMAFVLGHELGHIKLGHVPHKNFLGHCTGGNYVWKNSEADADRFSLAVISKAKYDACKGGSGFFMLLSRKYGNLGGPADPHPTNKFRLQQVEEYSCS